MSLEFTISALVIFLPLTFSLTQIMSLNFLSSAVDVDLFLDARKELYHNKKSDCSFRKDVWTSLDQDPNSELDLSLFRIKKDCSPSSHDSQLEASIEWQNVTMKRKVHLRVN